MIANSSPQRSNPVIDDALLLEILQGTPIPTFVIDSEHTITHWNTACENTTGFSARQMVGTKEHWKAFYTQARPLMIDLILDKATEEEISRNYSHWRCSKMVPGAYEAEDYFASMGKAGTWLYFTAALLRNVQGQVIGAIETLQDISDRKRAEDRLKNYNDQLEEQVRQRTSELSEVNWQLLIEINAHQEARDKLHQAHQELSLEAAALALTNEDLTQYASTVSHDLRSPLRAIRFYADILQEELEGVLNEKQAKHFCGLKKALVRGEDLVRDLLEYSQVTKKEIFSQRIEPELVFKELISAKHIADDVEVLMHDDWPLIACDQTLFEQIFCNLISNALKFNGSQKKILELGWLKQDNGRCELFVRDNGIGIEARYHEQVFQMLQRLHTQQEYEGTGIGLAIVRKAAERLNGSVRLESLPEQGSTFYVSLPLWKSS
ncbi:MAG TPA: ATP-binding protein [Desulfuromonadaceae bacterium]